MKNEEQSIDGTPQILQNLSSPTQLNVGENTQKQTLNISPSLSRKRVLNNKRQNGSFIHCKSPISMTSSYNIEDSPILVNFDSSQHTNFGLLSYEATLTKSPLLQPPTTIYSTSSPPYSRYWINDAF